MEKRKQSAIIQIQVQESIDNENILLDVINEE